MKIEKKEEFKLAYENINQIKWLLFILKNAPVEIKLM